MMYDYKEHYDSFYRGKGAYHWIRGDTEVVDIIRGHFLTKTDGKLLDVGCGDGWVLSHFTKDFTCYGVDVSKVAIDLAKQRFSEHGLKAKFEVRSATKLRYADNQFDVVLFIDCIEHLTLEDGVRALNEIYRVLKPGGEVIICTPNLCDEYVIDKSDVPEALRKVLPDKIKNSDFSEPEHHLHEYEREELKNVVESCGFSIQRSGVGGCLCVVVGGYIGCEKVCDFEFIIPYDKQFICATKTC